MRNIFKVFATDVKRIGNNVVAVVIIMGLSILPSLYAWFNILSNWDPYGEEATSRIKVAVATDDEGFSIAGLTLNVGDSVIEGLKSNKTIGWVFLDTAEEAVEGVTAGDYYAALVIPEEFTQDMVSFLEGELRHPTIYYYENEKRNAIAPKITAKAKTTVQEQVNATFISTLTGAVMEISNALSGAEEEGQVLSGVTESLDTVSAELTGYVNMLNSFVSIMDSAESIMATSQAMLPDVDSMLAAGRDSVYSLQSMLIAGSSTADTMADMVTASMNIVQTNLNSLYNIVSQEISRLEGYESIAGTGSAAAAAMVPYLQDIFRSIVENVETDGETQKQIDEINASFEEIQRDLEYLSAFSTQMGIDGAALRTQILNETEYCLQLLNNLSNQFQYTVRPSFRNTVNSMQQAMLSAAAMLNVNGVDFGEVSSVLSDYQATLSSGTLGLQQSLELAEEFLESINSLRKDMETLQGSGQLQELLEILKTDPDFLAEFASSPVYLDTIGVYHIEGYGSTTAPFYSILAIWVGALILVAIIHVHVHPIEGADNLKPYQKYFGRYMIFFLIGQTQTLITVLGDLYYIRIQCQYPFLFWLAGAVSSFVFTLFIYSVTVAFGNIGEAIAIVVMVIQVAGAGGTYPVEVLPRVYQLIYRFLPFPYGMNAMRETIGGMYQMDYWKDLGVMGIYALISLFIGLVLEAPFRRLNHIIEKSKEKTGMMI